MPDSIVAAIRNRVDPVVHRPRPAKVNPPLDHEVHPIGAVPGSGVTYFSRLVEAVSGPDASTTTGPAPHLFPGNSINVLA